MSRIETVPKSGLPSHPHYFYYQKTPAGVISEPTRTGRLLSPRPAILEIKYARAGIANSSLFD